jgi:flagellar basal-body rod protein FlgF
MDRGSYIAASGGMLQMQKLEVQNNNIANINTVGFKKQFVTAESQSFQNTFASLLGTRAPFAQPDHERTPGVENLQVRTDFSQGPIKNTGNPFDVALRNANDFFVLNTPQGPMYTRAGDFTLSAASELVTQDGVTVSGDGGPIQITGPRPTIDASGGIRVNGLQVGRLQVVKVDDPSKLERVAGTRFKLAAGAAQPQPVETQVIPQSLEMSNVSPISSMVDLIVTNRAFEAYTKVSQTIDQMNQSSITQIGRRQ